MPTASLDRYLPSWPRRNGIGTGGGLGFSSAARSAAIFSQAACRRLFSAMDWPSRQTATGNRVAGQAGCGRPMILGPLFLPHRFHFRVAARRGEQVAIVILGQAFAGLGTVGALILCEVGILFRCATEQRAAEAGKSGGRRQRVCRGRAARPWAVERERGWERWSAFCEDHAHQWSKAPARPMAAATGWFRAPDWQSLLGATATAGSTAGRSPARRGQASRPRLAAASSRAALVS